MRWGKQNVKSHKDEWLSYFRRLKFHCNVYKWFSLIFYRQLYLSPSCLRSIIQLLLCIICLNESDRHLYQDDREDISGTKRKRNIFVERMHVNLHKWNIWMEHHCGNWNFDNCIYLVVVARRSRPSYIMIREWIYGRCENGV